MAHRVAVWLVEEQNLPWDRKSYTGGAFLKPDLTKEQICFKLAAGIAFVFRRLFLIVFWLFIQHLEIDPVSFFPNLQLSGTLMPDASEANFPRVEH